MKLDLLTVVELVLELGVVLVTSAVTFMLVGAPVYLGIGTVIALLLLAVFVANGLHHLLADRAFAPAWFVGTVFIAMFLGACWPLGPVTLAYHRVKLIAPGDDEPDA